MLAVPVVLPSMSDAIEIQVMDQDLADADDVVATRRLSLAALQRRPSLHLRPSWLHFYGAPEATNQWFVTEIVIGLV